MAALEAAIHKLLEPLFGHHSPLLDIPVTS